MHDQRLVLKQGFVWWRNTNHTQTDGFFTPLVFLGNALSALGTHRSCSSQRKVRGGIEQPFLAYPTSRTQLGVLDPFAEQEHYRISPYCQSRRTLRAELESWIHPYETCRPFGERKDRKVPDKRWSLSKAAEKGSSWLDCSALGWVVDTFLGICSLGFLPASAEYCAVHSRCWDQAKELYYQWVQWMTSGTNLVLAIVINQTWSRNHLKVNSENNCFCHFGEKYLHWSK